MVCEAGTLMGKLLTVEYLIGCTNTAPESNASWLKMGAMRSKDLELAWDTVDVTADDTEGNIRQNLATFKTLSFSGNGLIRNDDTTQVNNYFTLLQHIANPSADTGGQPLGWLRLRDPIKTWVIPVLFTEFSESNPYEDATTYSLSATAASSKIPISLTRTPDEPSGD